ncbi:N-formylglutamate amidohydrolase [Endosaccharibacter trunci]|uniref:N-formylglutamate amidohydrolase n=1 Tax=Endosaccharibacter trunci TaxID=2812733 RepID=UPI003BF51678
MLSPADGEPVEWLRRDGRSPWLLVVDHAGRAVPQALDRLGLPDSEFERHIAWDIGVRGVSETLAVSLDATTIAQRFSRLVIDCNRTPGHPTSIAPVSDHTPIERNRVASAEERDARRDLIFTPYQDAIAAEIARRQAAGQDTVLVAVHSFTPRMNGFDRPWHFGVLFNHERRLGQALLRLAEAEGDLVVGENEPYALSDVDDYTVPVQGERRGLLCVELEIRQDLIADEAGQRAWADRLSRLLPAALAAVRADGG